MERLKITIRPAPSEGGLLRVSDAMQQVLDVVRLHEEARAAISTSANSFEWRLEEASTNSPFSIVAIAEASDPNADIATLVRRVTSEVSAGLRQLVEYGEPAPWMGAGAMNVARTLFARNQNGIGSTEFAAEGAVSFVLDRVGADAGLRAFSGIEAINIELHAGDREAWGEIRGVILAVGRYWNKPAIQIRTSEYDVVWCQLSGELPSEYGDEHKMREVWEGKEIGVEGTLIYSKSGRLRIIATGIRSIPGVPRIDLESVLDPNFTSGLDPLEYLRQLHDGKLAF